MSKRYRPKQRTPVYLFPILLGMSGVLFARQLDNPVLSGIIILLSVAAPLFAGGNILARLHSRGIQRVLVVAGLIMLTVGALVTVSGFSESLIRLEDVPKSVIELSRWIGISSLLLGLLAILFVVVRAEEVIGEIGERFHHLAERMGEGFMLTTPEGVITIVNQRLLDMTGLSERDLVGRNVRELAEDLRFEPIVSQGDHRGKGAASEYQITWTINGEERHFWVSGTPIYTRKGYLEGALATVRDITEIVRLSKSLEQYNQDLQELVDSRTEQLRQSELRLRDLLVNMNEGFLTLDTEFRIRFANQRICDLLQVRSDEIRGRNLFDFVDSADRGKLLDLFELGGPSSAACVQQEMSLIQSDGSSVAVVAAIAPIRDAQEGVRSSLAITDVSELKRMQRQLEERAGELEAANDELKMLDRAKDTFLSNVTHELRTPLSTIRGYLEMFNAGNLGNLADRQRDAFGAMARNVQRLRVLIDEMIGFSRMEIRGIQLTTTLFSLEDLIDECVSSAQPQVMPEDITLSAHLPEDMPPIWGDREKIGQVLTIFLSNAIKFTHHGGAIRIQVGPRFRHGVGISVADTGIGIEPEYQQRIFDKFFQVDSSLNRRYQGAGIGLSIAKSIAEAHGGEIELASEARKGSTFTLFLPNSLFDRDIGPDRPESMAGLRVLVAEDKRELREIMAGVLMECECAVRYVNNGYECVRVAQAMRPDLVILDEAMAGMTGYGTCLKLQQHPETKDIPIIMLIGSSNAEPPRDGDLQGVVRHLLKPFTAYDLVSRVCQVCFEDTADNVAAPLLPETVTARLRASVLVVSPDTNLLEWLETALNRRKVGFRSAKNAREALELVEDSTPDLIFVDIDDIDAPESDSVDRLRVFRDTDAAKDIPLYVISSLPAEQHVASGAAGALRKPFSIKEITEIVLAPPIRSGRGA